MPRNLVDEGNDSVKLLAIELRWLSAMLPGYFRRPPKYLAKIELDEKGQAKGTAIPTPDGYAGEHREAGIERVAVLKRKVAKLTRNRSPDRIDEVLNDARGMLKQNEPVPDEEVSNVAGRLRKVADQLRDADQISLVKAKTGLKILDQPEREAIEKVWQQEYKAHCDSQDPPITPHWDEGLVNFINARGPELLKEKSESDLKDLYVKRMRNIRDEQKAPKKRK